jgi:DNA-binding CsgD family transcriptional regulator
MRTRHDAAVEEAGHGLVGREGVLAALADAIAHERPTAVVGEAGIGKTSLVRAAVTRTGRRLHEGGGFATLTWMPYLALRRATGSALAGDAAGVAATVERRVGPDVLFVDDLQWVDARSLAALRLLAGRLLVVAAIRAEDDGAQPALDHATETGLSVVRLEALTRTAMAELLARLRPDGDEAAASRLLDRAAGNPLLLEELVSATPGSPTLVRALRTRLDRLSPSARDLVRVLAVADRPLPPARLGSALGEVTEAGLVVQGAGGATLRHALLAEAIRADLADPERRTHHRRVARLVDEPGAVARHLAAGGRRREAAAVASDAAAAGVTDPLERAALAVIVADAAGGPTRLAARLEAARGLDELSDWDGVERTLQPRPAQASSAARVEREVLLARAAYGQGRLDDARRRLRRAEQVPLDGAHPVAATRSIEVSRFAVNVDGDVATAVGRLQAELASRPPDDPATQDVRTLLASILALAMGHGDADALRVAADQALDAGRYRTAAEGARVVQFLLLMQDGPIPALDWANDRRRRFAERDLAGIAHEFHAESLNASILAGRPADAVREADALLEEPAPLRARQTALINRARALVLLGRYDAATATLARLADATTADYFGAMEALGVEAELELWSGRPVRAIALADRAVAYQTPVPGGDIPTRLTRRWAEWEAGTPVDGALPPITLRSLQGAIAEVRGIGFLGPVGASADPAGRTENVSPPGDSARSRGGATDPRGGSPAAAAEAFAEAAALWAGFHEPKRVTCRWALGEAERRAGRRDDAVATLTDALADAIAMGAEPLAARARRSLRLAGVRVPAGRRSSATTALGLTSREQELLVLVGRGLTNIEIARRLGLGRPTVARIVASAMDKVGADRRAQLAAFVATR